MQSNESTENIMRSNHMKPDENEIKWNQIKWNTTKSNEIKWNHMKSIEIKKMEWNQIKYEIEINWNQMTHFPRQGVEKLFGACIWPFCHIFLHFGAFNI